MFKGCIIEVKHTAILFFALLVISSGSMGMSIFSGTKNCVFSSVQVQLLMNGQPVKHAKVLRKWNWNKNRADETLTDKNGIAKFPAIYESSAWPIKRDTHS